MMSSLPQTRKGPQCNNNHFFFLKKKKNKTKTTTTTPVTALTSKPQEQPQQPTFFFFRPRPQPPFARIVSRCAPRKGPLLSDWANWCRQRRRRRQLTPLISNGFRGEGEGGGGYKILAQRHLDRIGQQFLCFFKGRHCRIADVYVSSLLLSAHLSSSGYVGWAATVAVVHTTPRNDTVDMGHGGVNFGWWSVWRC